MVQYKIEIVLLLTADSIFLYSTENILLCLNSQLMYSGRCRRSVGRLQTLHMGGQAYDTLLYLYCFFNISRRTFNDGPPETFQKYCTVYIYRKCNHTFSSSYQCNFLYIKNIVYTILNFDINDVSNFEQYALII